MKTGPTDVAEVLEPGRRVRNFTGAFASAEAAQWTGPGTFFASAMPGPLTVLPDQLVKCEYCGRYGPLGSCEGCGAPNRPTTDRAVRFPPFVRGGR